jgi:serine/threonine protein kinase
MPKPIRRIGASKLATVSECQTPQGTHVALKEYNRQPLTPSQHQHIFAAAERWRTLSMPGLVTYLEVAPQRNEVVMELFDRSAAMRLSEGRSDPRLVLHALRSILAALTQLHEQGWLHVNLKPSNVFFDGAGRARLSDGLLISVSTPLAPPPPSNHKYSTPEHTSPACGPMTPASDLYAVGFMALELLAGDRFGRAFQGVGDDTTDDDVAWLRWHASSSEAPSAHSFSPNCPAELTAVIARLVAKQPSLRYSSARQALAELPQDISAQAKLVSQALPQPLQPEALSAHVVERPATGIVLAIASGSRAGEMIGTNENELMIGFDHDCFLRFPDDQYPLGGGKVLLRRGPEGWYVLRVSGNSAFINQHLLEEKSPLRSGDIVRLSSRGPDIQFTMQSGGVAIRAMVDRFLPSKTQRALGHATTANQAATGLMSASAAAHPAGNSADTPQPATAAAPLPASAPQPWSKHRTTTLIAVLVGSLVLTAVTLYLSSRPTAATNLQVHEPTATEKADQVAPENLEQADSKAITTNAADTSLQQISQPAPLTVETK